MRHPIPRYSYLAFQFNMLLDQGHSMPMDETKQRIADGSLFDRLEELYGHEPHYLDVSLYEGDERRTILNAFESLANAVDEGRKLGVGHNGLSLCLAYCIEIIQHPDGFEEEA